MIYFINHTLHKLLIILMTLISINDLLKNHITITRADPIDSNIKVNFSPRQTKIHSNVKNQEGLEHYMQMIMHLVEDRV